MTLPLFDAHLDLAWNAVSWGRDISAPLEAINAAERYMAGQRPRGRATTCLPEMRRGAVAACLATLLARAPRFHEPLRQENLRTCLDYPNQEVACAVARGQLAYYTELERRNEIRLLRTARDLAAHWSAWTQASPAARNAISTGHERAEPAAASHPGDTKQPDASPIGVILAMEGADPITSPDELETWWNDGVRSLGLVHYGHGCYATGTGAAGPLTSKGIDLLREMRRVGMILDVTHLSDDGFFEALDHFDGPVMASHNNCRALVPGDRQFSDQQIRHLLERDAVIGVAFDAWMLHPGWEIGRTRRSVVQLAAAADHIDHICQLAGNCRHVAIGSDLDGGFGTEQTPVGLDSIADLQKLAGILDQHGYVSDSIEAIFHGNWLRFFQQHLSRNSEDTQDTRLRRSPP
jgi:membrane dipeptidase